MLRKRGLVVIGVPMVEPEPAGRASWIMDGRLIPLNRGLVLHQYSPFIDANYYCS